MHTLRASRVCVCNAQAMATTQNTVHTRPNDTMPVSRQPGEGGRLQHNEPELSHEVRKQVGEVVHRVVTFLFAPGYATNFTTDVALVRVVTDVSKDDVPTVRLLAVRDGKELDCLEVSCAHPTASAPPLAAKARIKSELASRLMHAVRGYGRAFSNESELAASTSNAEGGCVLPKLLLQTLNEGAMRTLDAVEASLDAWGASVERARFNATWVERLCAAGADTTPYDMVLDVRLDAREHRDVCVARRRAAGVGVKRQWKTAIQRAELIIQELHLAAP